jgi:dinuclear metal center YbgI/SA1388 family protein
MGEGDRLFIRGYELIEAMERYAPPSFAVEKDRIGLQVGNPAAAVKGILVTLDVTEQVVDEAIQRGANWIIAHHAPLFHPLQELRTDQPLGRLLAKLLQHELHVYVAHTNLDAAEGGVNDVLAEKLQLKQPELLIRYGEDKLKKLVVFVPEEHHSAVLQAMATAGAGWIGNYSHCTFNLFGEGTFLPRGGTQPFIGEPGKLEKVKEIRLETVMRASMQAKVVQAMLSAHPYEEVAYDIYPLDVPGKAIGFGKIGYLDRPIPLQELAQRIQQVFAVEGMRVVGSWRQSVHRVAILGGSGGKYWTHAKQLGADVYITGDIDYHTAQEAFMAGLCLIDPGHHVEHWVVERVCQVLREAWQDQVAIAGSQVNTNPFRFLFT